MVGLAVGLISVLLITQIMSTFQASRNSISFGADAQENGLFALQVIATDVREAGAGYYSSPATTQVSAASCANVCTCDGTKGCTTGWCSNPSANVTGTGTGALAEAIPAMSGISPTPNKAPIPLVPLAPVLIDTYANCCSASGGSVAATYAGNSDVVTVRMAARLTGVVPTASSGASFLAAGNTISVKRTFGFSQNDLALVSDGSNCALIQLTNPASPLGHEVSSVSGANFNPTPSSTSFWPATLGSGQVFNVGNVSAPKGAIIAREYSVPRTSGTGATGRGNSLQLRKMDFGATDAMVPDNLANGIVALRAQYGIAAQANTLAITGWVGPDDTTWNSTWDPSVLTQGNMQLIRAVRIVVVARSGTREGALVTPPCIANDANYGLGPCPWALTPADTANPTPPAIRLATSAADTEWQHYRYKVYTSIIPLRNVLWNLQ